MDEATLRSGLKKFYAVMEKYAHLGLCDTEGWVAMGDWFEKASKSEPTKPITYRYLQCFDVLYGPDSEVETVVSDEAKQMVAAEVSAAAEELLPIICKAKRAGLIEDVYYTIRWRG